MGLFKKRAKKKPKRPQGDHMEIYVKCGRCGEIIKTHIVMSHELMPTYEEQGPAYILKKELIGYNCQNRVRLAVFFDASKRILSRDITGGTFGELKEL
ncbi:MAG: hypothetical protein JXQ30_05615 [Spirochaetes bacterium]|nr:hypothetical protein [Spirochaetota bacterium]